MESTKIISYQQFISVSRIITMAMFLLSVTACTKLGPDFVTPEAPIEPRWLEGSHEKLRSEGDFETSWWTQFDDAALNKIITRARNQNLSLQVAGLRVLQSRSQLGIAVGNKFPQSQRVTGGLRQIKLSENEPNAIPGFQDESYREANLGFEIGWELDLWGKFARGIEAANAELLASVATYDDILVTLCADVATSYVLIRTFENRLNIANENVAIQKSSLELAETRFRHGATTELDVQQARTLLRNTEASIPNLQIGLQQAKNALSTLLGQAPSDLSALIGEQSDIPSAPASVATGIPSELLRRRPDIRRAEHLAAAQSARIGIAESALYPQFSLTGSVGFRSSDTFRSDLSDITNLDSLEGLAGPSFSWDIFNYGRLKNNIRVQDARFQGLLVAYQNTVIRAAQEVEDAMAGFLRASEQIDLLQDAVEAARRSVEIALIQYRDGAVDYQRVLQTQDALVSQQDRLMSTRGAVARNLIAMYRALGGGWETGETFLISDQSVAAMKSRTDWDGELDASKRETEASK